MAFLSKVVLSLETHFSSPFVLLLLHSSPCAQLSSSECVINLCFFALLIQLVILLRFSQGSSNLCLNLHSLGFASPICNNDFFCCL